MTALHAYQHAAQLERRRSARCGLSWPLLAGIGRVESDHGHFAGAILGSDGVSMPWIIGIPLDGQGTARILDTDHGRLDGDPLFDRAVGPMQFIPATWARYGADGNNDHRIDPFNIFDAALTTADYLCAASDGTLTTRNGQIRAVLTYNQSEAYLALVLQLERLYAHRVPGLTTPVLLARGAVHPRPTPGIPAANPGTALGAGPGHATRRPRITATKPPTTAPTGTSVPRPTGVGSPPSSTPCPSTTTIRPSTSPPGSETTSPAPRPTDQPASTSDTPGTPTVTATDSPTPRLTRTRQRCP